MSTSPVSYKGQTTIRATWTPTELERIKIICKGFAGFVMAFGGYAMFWLLDWFRKDHHRTWFGAYSIFRTHPRTTIDTLMIVLLGVVIIGLVMIYRVLNFVPDKE